MRKDDSIYIDHIFECIDKINIFCEGVDWLVFESNVMLQDAVIRNIEIIGEASKKLSNDFRIKNKNIPWSDIAGMRDKLIHDYFGVDVEVVWQTVTQDIPLLEKLLKEIQ